jgi:hypothetical protein
LFLSQGFGWSPPAIDPAAAVSYRGATMNLNSGRCNSNSKFFVDRLFDLDRFDKFDGTLDEHCVVS